MSGVDRLLRLYPARYRAAHGEEIAAVFAEATTGLSRRALRRERAALAAHALRLRVRIGSADPAGRALAGAAPFALAGLAGLCLLMALAMVQGAVLALSAQRGVDAGGVLFQAVDGLPALAALGCAVAGRWSAARVLLLITAAEKLVVLALARQLWDYLPASPDGWLIGSALFALLALLAPPDLAAPAFVGPRRRLAMGLVAACSVAPIVLANELFLNSGLHPFVKLEPAWPLLFPAAGVLAALLGRPADRARAVGAALVVLPWALTFTVSNTTPEGLLTHLAVAAAPPVAAVVLAAVVRRVVRGTVLPPLDPV